MKLLFDKLKTSDGIVRVSFDGEVTWNEYHVADVKDTGITFTEEDCPDLTKIRIAGAITKISDIKTHIINESISQDLTTDEQIENLRLQINNLGSNEEVNTLKTRFENYLWSIAPEKELQWDTSNESRYDVPGTNYTYDIFIKEKHIPITSNIRIKNNDNLYMPIKEANLSPFLALDTDINTIFSIPNYSAAFNCNLFTEKEIAQMLIDRSAIPSYNLENSDELNLIKNIITFAENSGEYASKIIIPMELITLCNICGINSPTLSNFSQQNNIPYYEYATVYLNIKLSNYNILKYVDFTNIKTSILNLMPQSTTLMNRGSQNNYNGSFDLNIEFTVTDSGSLKIQTDCYNLINYISAYTPRVTLDNGTKLSGKSSFFYKLLQYYFNYEGISDTTIVYDSLYGLTSSNSDTIIGPIQQFCPLYYNLCDIYLHKNTDIKMQITDNELILKRYSTNLQADPIVYKELEF